MTPIVADAGPLISFARAGQLPLLQQIVKRLLIPEAVYHEVVTEGAHRPPAADVEAGLWVLTHRLGADSTPAGLPPALGRGEKEAIALSQERAAPLLADDPVARREARARGVPLISTLDVLDEAKSRHLIEAVRPVLDQFIRTGFRLKRTLYDTKLREAGE